MTDDGATGRGQETAPFPEHSVDEAALSATSEPPPDFSPGLTVVRRRRRYLWIVILGYLPAMWLVLRIDNTYRTVFKAFGAWFVLLFVVTFVAALARCPRCGHYYHMNGPSLLFLRRCLHCQLKINADRQ